MFTDRPVRTTIAVKDIERAKRWYGEKLDLKPVRESPAGVSYDCGEGTGFELYPSQFAGTGQQTVMGFATPDLESDIEELKGRGVTFESYDLPGIKTDDRGIADLGGERGAWFKDSEGNILSLFQTSS